MMTRFSNSASVHATVYSQQFLHNSKSNHGQFLGNLEKEQKGEHNYM